MEIYGIFGFPLKHSLSSAMQEAAFEKFGIDAVYLPFEIDRQNFRRVGRNLSTSLLEGFNLTVPYKEIVIPYLDEVTKETSLIGAVNTVKRVGKRFRGYNTDEEGFRRALREARFNAKGKRAVILGAGGAARACVYGLARERIREVAIFNRHVGKARKIGKDFQKLFANTAIKAFSLNRTFLKAALSETDLVINATSVGLKKNDAPLIDNGMWPKKKLLVYDLVYNPPVTSLLKAARRQGNRVLNGLTMLLYQGAKAFEIWTGLEAPEALMWRILKAASEKR